MGEERARDGGRERERERGRESGREGGREGGREREREAGTPHQNHARCDSRNKDPRLSVMLSAISSMSACVRATAAIGT
jgi:hypothetical protein